MYSTSYSPITSVVIRRCSGSETVQIFKSVTVSFKSIWVFPVWHWRNAQEVMDFTFPAAATCLFALNKERTCERATVKSDSWKKIAPKIKGKESTALRTHHFEWSLAQKHSKTGEHQRYLANKTQITTFSCRQWRAFANFSSFPVLRVSGSQVRQVPQLSEAQWRSVQVARL